MRLEICANSFQSAKNAQTAGAHRIELCQALNLGGLTPSYGLMKNVIETLAIETFVLIRPRCGHFYYSKQEFIQMIEDIKIAKDLGCHGIVSGVLLENGLIDIERTKQLIDLTHPLPFTFHRAFDCVPNPIQSIDELIKLKVDRVLTSGQAVNAELGLSMLKILLKKAEENIIVLPGCGITPTNVQLFKKEGFKELHASASVKWSDDTTLFGTTQTLSDETLIRSLLRKMK